MTGAGAAIDALPGFRRRIVVTPADACVRAAVEDDYHAMHVVVRHDGATATAIEASMTRVPWTTCPGAPAVLARTFAGLPLDAFAARGAKTANCTHLHDLALLAAAHAADADPLVYDILVSDPVDEVSHAEIRRNGAAAIAWTIEGPRLSAPGEIAGLGLDMLSPWIGTLDPARREEARLLRWGVMLAHGRTRAARGGFDKADLPRGQCYTFQPERAAVTDYNRGTVRDFGPGGAESLTLAAEPPRGAAATSR